MSQPSPLTRRRDPAPLRPAQAASAHAYGTPAAPGGTAPTPAGGTAPLATEPAVEAAATAPTTFAAAVSSGAFAAAAAGGSSSAATIAVFAGLVFATFLIVLLRLTPLPRPILFISLNERPG